MEGKKDGLRGKPRSETQKGMDRISLARASQQGEGKRRKYIGHDTFNT